MQNEKLKRIINTKSSFPAEEIESMSDADGWNWVYANAKPSKEKLTQICFTGFSAQEKAELTTLAEESHLDVVTSVTKDLAFLCIGENAGPAKLEKAKEQGVHILSRSQFEHLLETGDIKDA
jgi:NAD-dependent DNA ligase